ncbi:MAG: betaine--homocysteine S-methyltransferase [Anaerolineales bacterium]
MRARLPDLLANGRPLLADGAMGTMLFSMGLEQGDSPELWNLEHPDRVRLVHRAYIEAGSQIIMTNSFGANRERLGLHGLSGRARELNFAAAQLARAEADAAAHPVLVAGSMGPTGSILEPLGELSFVDAVSAFQEQGSALVEGGIDVFWIETMFDLEEARAAVEACRTASAELPIFATMTFDTAGHTMMGVSPEDAVSALQKLGVQALGGNCGNGPGEIEGVLQSMQAQEPTAAIASKSNAGIPHLADGKAVYDATPEHMAEHAILARQLGAQIIGACCGSTPDHIRAMAAALEEDGST